MLVSNATLSGNRARGGGQSDGSVNTAEGMGGGILNVAGANLTIDDSTFTGNAAVGGDHNTLDLTSFPVGLLAGAGQGGALLNAGATATVIGSTFTGNHAKGGNNDMGPGSIATGGAIDNLGTALAAAPAALTVLDSTFSNNAAIGGHGGPIAPLSSAPANTPPGSFVFANFAAGGAIDTSFAGQASVLDATFKGNQAIGGAAGSTQQGGEAFGGGIAVGMGMLLNVSDAATLTLTDSTLTGNAAIGGTGGPPAVWAVPSPIGSNLPTGAGLSFEPAGPGGLGFGGALAVQAGSANVTGSTITSNYARGGASGGVGGSPGAGYGGGVDMNYQSSVTFDPDTVIAKNHASLASDSDTYTDFMGSAA